MSRLTFPATIAALAVPLLAADVAAQDVAGNAEAGRTAYESSCGECHSSAARLGRRLSDDKAAEATRLDDFLAHHHAADATVRKDIIAYLLGL